MFKMSMTSKNEITFIYHTSMVDMILTSVPQRLISGGDYHVITSSRMPVNRGNVMSYYNIKGLLHN